MKYLLPLLTLTLLFSQELEVEGDLKVTGTVESATIDSLEQVIANLQAQIDAMQADNQLETRVYSVTLSENQLSLNIYTDLDYPIEAELDFYFLKIISVENLDYIGGDNYAIELRQDGGNKRSSIVCGQLDNCYYPHDGMGIGLLSIEGSFTGPQLSVVGLPTTAITPTFKLAITAQFPD